MKTEALFYIIGFFLLIVALILEIKKSDNILSKYFVRLSLVIFFLTVVGQRITFYDLTTEQKFWSKHNLPLIDSSMQVQFIMTNNIFYKSSCKDSIRHDSKSIKYDMFDIYSYEDIFLNEKVNKKLILEYRRKNLLHDSLRQITIEPIESIDTIKLKTLSKIEFDSIISAWGLTKVFTKEIIRR